MTPRLLVLAAVFGLLTACSNYGSSTQHGASGVTVFGEVDAAVTRNR